MESKSYGRTKRMGRGSRNRRANNLLATRSAGVLLHPTSLPGPYGVGEIGPHARMFVDMACDMGLHLWQILPLGPTGYGDSPYQSLSSFAANPMLISLDNLVSDGLLSPYACRELMCLRADRVDFGHMIPLKQKCLTMAADTFLTAASPSQRHAFEAFCRASREWLSDYALFDTLKTAQGGAPWVTWPTEIARRDPSALKKVARALSREIARTKVIQFFFHQQWAALREYAARRHVSIIGDVPIFAAHDSADVWARPDLFRLDQHGYPTVVAGVPPDYFCETGQRWGNPLYAWEVHRAERFKWWTARLRRTFEWSDIIRIDHFRGFEACWEIPAEEPTAVCGRWVPAPGQEFFEMVRRRVRPLAVIAEDLGFITPEVHALRAALGFPGMKVLQFMFGDGVPAWDKIPADVVLYTGTHDNDTMAGWFRGELGQEHVFARELINRLQSCSTDGTAPVQIHWDMIRLALSTPAVAVLFPMQDVLGLDSSSRMNTPGTTQGNWTWRFSWEQISERVVKEMNARVCASGRA